MKICCVPDCKNDSVRRPDLSFFNLPRQSNIRNEWLDAVSVKQRESTDFLAVCENHFRSKDFVAGKKQLKAHAIPVLKLGAGKTDPQGSEDEFTLCNSDSDDDIVEMKELSVVATKLDFGVNTKSLEKSVIKPDPPAETEQEVSRRPSRRAAQVAAKKIFNTVRNFGLGTETDNSESHNPSKPSSSAISSRPASSRPYLRQRQRSTKPVQPNTELIMECHEEILSAVQAEAMLKAQLEYNMVMKTLRNLKANNVKIIFHTADDQPAEIIEPTVTLSPLNITIKRGKIGVLPNRKPPNVVTLTAVKSDNAAVVPVKLSRVH